MNDIERGLNTLERIEGHIARLAGLESDTQEMEIARTDYRSLLQRVLEDWPHLPAEVTEPERELMRNMLRAELALEGERHQ